MVGQSTRGTRLGLALRRLCGAGLALLVVIAPACSGPSAPRGRVVDVTLRDFHVAVSAQAGEAGTFSFSVHSRGPTTHEFLVARTDLPASSLPLGADGIRVAEDAPSVHVAGEEEAIDLGDTTTLTLHLAPGHYVLFCNMEGHYLAGMRASFTVS